MSEAFGSAAVIKSSVGEGLDASIHRLFPFLFRRPLPPDALTVCGALVSTVAAGVLASGALRVGGLLVLAGGFFDLVDGVVARHNGRSSRFGAFLDSTLDRWVDMILLVGISVHYARSNAPGQVALAGVALATGVMVSYAKARAELEIARFEVGLVERAERIIVLAAGAIFGLLPLALWIIVIGSGITLAQRIQLAHREMRRLDEAERAGLEESSP